MTSESTCASVTRLRAVSSPPNLDSLHWTTRDIRMDDICFAREKHRSWRRNRFLVSAFSCMRKPPIIEKNLNWGPSHSPVIECAIASGNPELEKSPAGATFWRYLCELRSIEHLFPTGEVILLQWGLLAVWFLVRQAQEHLLFRHYNSPAIDFRRHQIFVMKNVFNPQFHLYLLMLSARQVAAREICTESSQNISKRNTSKFKIITFTN